ncbi:hypothetical protein [Acidaminobacter sp. JC074]|nr:hypothetical protein [Acidaminobacter sp. JC074]
MGFFNIKGDEPTGNEPLNIRKDPSDSKFNLIAGIVIVVVFVIAFLFFA